LVVTAGFGIFGSIPIFPAAGSFSIIPDDTARTKYAAATVVCIFYRNPPTVRVIYIARFDIFLKRIAPFPFPAGQAHTGIIFDASSDKLFNRVKVYIFSIPYSLRLFCMEQLIRWFPTPTAAKGFKPIVWFASQQPSRKQGFAVGFFNAVCVLGDTFFRRNIHCFFFIYAVIPVFAHFGRRIKDFIWIIFVFCKSRHAASHLIIFFQVIR
jgi:hypothetical protein